VAARLNPLGSLFRRQRSMLAECLHARSRLPPGIYLAPPSLSLHPHAGQEEAAAGQRGWEGGEKKGEGGKGERGKGGFKREEMFGEEKALKQHCPLYGHLKPITPPPPPHPHPPRQTNTMTIHMQNESRTAHFCLFPSPAPMVGGLKIAAWC